MADSTTKKFNTFVSRPLQDCTLSDVPGVGVSTLHKLVAAGINTPEKLIGMYFMNNREPEHGRQPAPLNDHLSIFSNNFFNFIIL
jgi:hypothetical protein